MAAVLIGYGVALPRREYAAAQRERRFAIAPAFGRNYAGLALTLRR